jgi:hypothetical protein
MGTMFIKTSRKTKAEMVGPGGGGFNPLNVELNPICHLLALLGAHPNLHISRIRVNIFRPRTGLGNILRMRAQTVDNLRNSFSCGNVNLQAPYFRLFQLRRSVSYRVAPWTAAPASRG